MRWFTNLPIGVRIYGVAALGTIVLLITGANSLYHLHKTMNRDVALKTEHVVQTAHSVLSAYASMEKEGLLTREEAQADALRVLKNTRYGNNEYFWVNDMHPTMVMHPTKPELDGKDISQIKDPNGVALFSEMVKIVKAQGKGFVHYMWPKPGSDAPQPKISYVEPVPEWGWIVGSGVYVDDIKAAVNKAMIDLGVILGAALVLLIGLAIAITRSITVPLGAATDVMKSLSKGDLGVTVTGTDRRDEIGTMAQSIDIFRKQALELKEAEAKSAAMEEQARSERIRLMHQMADSFEASVSGVIAAITESASQMRANAETLNTISMTTREKATIVAAAAHETSVTSSTVAAASEELSASIREISSQVQKSSGIAEEVSQGTQSANEAMATLIEQTNSIHQVTEFINQVAGQINLLALNATIESARAGDAGKGFAVVAGEVKTLASQTTKASSQISGQIGNIQTASGSAEEQLKLVNGVISQIRQSITSIAAAIEEQAAATQEIVRNVNESSRAANDVSRNIVEVEQSAGQTDSNAREVLESARTLGEQADLLKQNVGQFLATIRQTGS